MEERSANKLQSIVPCKEQRNLLGRIIIGTPISYEWVSTRSYCSFSRPFFGFEGRSSVALSLLWRSKIRISELAHKAQSALKNFVVGFFFVYCMFMPRPRTKH